MVGACRGKKRRIFSPRLLEVGGYEIGQQEEGAGEEAVVIWALESVMVEVDQQEWW